MAQSAEQAIRVTARGEFGQLQRGLKSLQGDLKDVLGEINKGARKGGFFDDSSMRALELFKNRFKGTMEELNKEFEKQNSVIDKLYEKMKKGNSYQKWEIEQIIKKKEKELDVMRKQIIEMEKLYDKRTKEASGYTVNAPEESGGSSGGGSETFGALLSGLKGGAQFVLGLVGLGSIISLGQQAYQLARDRRINSLDLAQRIRGYGYNGSATDMYDTARTTGMQDMMGYKAAESWALLEAYTTRAGAIDPYQQGILQKFSRGYGLDATQVGSMVGGVKQLGGVTTPKEFADMISESVSKSGMLPRIMEVMEAHTQLLQNLRTSFKDGASSQILAYQTTLDKIGNANGMTALTGAQGANIISGFGGIFSPSQTKWKWTGMNALKQFDPAKYGGMSMYELEASFESGLENPDNFEAMADYLRKAAGGDNEFFRRLMQQWLMEGGFNATKPQVDELSKVTNGFTMFDKNKIEGVFGGNAEEKYEQERQQEKGQFLLDLEAQREANLTDFGEKYILPITDKLEWGFTEILTAINEGSFIARVAKGIKAAWEWIKEDLFGGGNKGGGVTSDSTNGAQEGAFNWGYKAGQWINEHLFGGSDNSQFSFGAAPGGGVIGYASSLSGVSGGTTNNTNYSSNGSAAAQILDNKFKGKLSGKGNNYVAAGQKYGIDPLLMGAISVIETGNGSSSMIYNKNNVGGFYSNGEFMSFKSIDESIDFMGRTLSGYKSEGRDTIPEIGAKYCPVGADNDPTGMNKNWVPEVTKEYERLKGLTSTNTTSSNTSGSSFFNGWQGRVTQKYSAGHGGLDIDGKTGDTLTALSGGKISFLYMDDGGKYDPDAMNSRAGGTEIGVMMPNGKQYFYSHLSNVNPEILQRWANGDRNIGINPGDYIGNIGGTPGVPGSGYSTTGDHLHLGLIDSNGNKINPEELLNSLNSGNSSIGDTGSSSHITVDININGDGAGKLNSMTISALKSLVQQTVEEIERRRLITQPAVRR